MTRGPSIESMHQLARRFGATIYGEQPYLRPSDNGQKGCPTGTEPYYGGHHSGGCYPASGYSRNLGAPIVLTSNRVTVYGPARRQIEELRDTLKALISKGMGGFRVVPSASSPLPETVETAEVKTIRWPVGQWTAWTTNWSAIASALAPVLGVIPAWPLGIQEGGSSLDPSHYAPTVAQAFPAVEDLLKKTKADDEKPWLLIGGIAAGVAAAGALAWALLK